LNGSIADAQAQNDDLTARLADTQTALNDITARYQAFLMERAAGESGSIANIDSTDTITFDESGRNATIHFANIAQTENDYEIEIVLADSQEILYRTARMKAGDTFETFTLENALASGTYNAFVKSFTYSKTSGDLIASLTFPAIIIVP